MNLEFHGEVNQVNSKMVNGSHRRATKQGTFSASASINARTDISFPARRKLAADHRFHFSANDGSNQHHHRHETENLVLFPFRLAIRTRRHVPSHPPIPTQSKANQTKPSHTSISLFSSLSTPFTSFSICALQSRRTRSHGALQDRLSNRRVRPLHLRLSLRPRRPSQVK